LGAVAGRTAPRCRRAATIFLGTTTDITPLKQAELALKQLNEELEQRVQERTQTLQTLAAVVENSTDLIALPASAVPHSTSTRAGRRLVGLEDEPLAGRPISTLHTAETRLRLEQEVLPTVIAEGVWRGEVDFCHGRTGEAIAVEQVAFLVKDPDTQAPLCLGTVCRDIRDRKRSEIERQQAELRPPGERGPLSPDCRNHSRGFLDGHGRLQPDFVR
jgi:PAS domain-containing protein